METRFENVTKIESLELFQKVSAYTDVLIEEATANGALSAQGADNEYTREIGRLGNLCADYESLHYKSKVLNFKSPVINTQNYPRHRYNPKVRVNNDSDLFHHSGLV
ncbi:MAG: hypothetical protein LBK45_02210 [Tannerellaceae bacterium]|nr:hypothetical protein [Tannerellaceae bacterium]